jgi:hypothetical protein
MLGPGRYNDLSVELFYKTKAKLLILMVGGGNRGDGFEVQTTPEDVPRLPGMLRHLADLIEADLKAEQVRAGQ